METRSLTGIERHRYRCPHGHANWEPRDGAFYCVTCLTRWGRDPYFRELEDDRTGEEIGPEAFDGIE
ncbi:hypothetical protein [Salinirubrum litoreum]|uniref:Uncharacterized protein n=1 Tax=Salinirubrum litoreum TaxID=1126234 RepID=A0ABD5RBE6_9EURY|nr:hypothetical protein [Salinirubrum litoreum]